MSHWKYARQIFGKGTNMPLLIVLCLFTLLNSYIFCVTKNTFYSHNTRKVIRDHRCIQHSFLSINKYIKAVRKTNRVKKVLYPLLAFPKTSLKVIKILKGISKVQKAMRLEFVTKIIKNKNCSKVQRLAISRTSLFHTSNLKVWRLKSLSKTLLIPSQQTVFKGYYKIKISNLHSSIKVNRVSYLGI